MLEILSGIMASSGFGVITGLVGSFLTKLEERKLRQAMNAHELEMANIDLQRDKLDHAHDLALADKQMDFAQVEGAIARDLAETNNIAETIKAQARPSGNAIIDGVLRFIRPAITAYLLVIVTILALKLHELTGGLERLDVEELFSLYKHIIYQLVFLTVTAVAWWFGSRGANARLPK